MRRIFAMCMAVAIMASVVQPVWASESELMAEIQALKAKLAEVDQLKAKVAELEKQVGEQRCSILSQQGSVNEVRQALIQSVPKEGLIKYEPGKGIEFGPCGFKIQADATFVVQGTPNANSPGSKNKSRCDASWSSDIYIEKSLDDWGLAFMHLEPGQNDGLEGDLSLYSNVNRDVNSTNANIPISEVWYSQYLFAKQMIITAGKMDPANYLDQNEYAFNETTQFLGRIFRNSPAIEWPNDNTIGGSMAVSPDVLPYIALNASYFNANNSYEDIFDKPFVSTQLTFIPARAFGYDEKMWGGNYRVYWWYNGLDHSKLTTQGESPADVVKEKNTGFGLSFDQKVTDVYGVFARFGWQRPDVTIVGTSPNSAPIEATWSGGFQMTGKYWHRQGDVFAFAVGQVFPSKAYKDAGNGGAAEGHFEAYYKLQINKNLALSPDVQWIWNPRGVSESYQGYDSSIFVYGVRGQIDF